MGIKGQIAWNKGKKGIYSEATRLKLRNKKLGGKLSEEHKRKIGVASKRLGLRPPVIKGENH